jgi:OOP family OmpA-OmpF porin
MRKIFLILTLIGIQSAIAQITTNPKVTKKSTNNTFINKIELTEDYTVVSMQYVSKSASESLKEYLENNPDEKEQLQRMNPMMRNMMLQQMIAGMGGSTISIQPTSFLRSKDGRVYSFVKASNIPVAPNKQNVEPEKKYFFKVFFKKLDSGIKSVDLVEGPNDERDGFQYWNFYGVEVNNPAIGEEAVVFQSSMEVIMSGKVFDAATNKPVQAKIICRKEGELGAFDSVRTSRTGYFEFLMNNESYEYEISAEGYETRLESMDLSKLKSLKAFERDIFMEPLAKDKEDAIEAKVVTEEPKEIVAEIERVDDKTLRLNNVYFAIGKASILEESHQELQKVIKLMQVNPDMKIRVDGHTDNQGDSHLNKILSLDRAKNVRDYLISGGISTERVSFKGCGDTQPIVTNASEDSRKKNRRVEIVILDE